MNALTPISESANLTVTTTDDGFLITADARRPAPEFRAMLRSLATPKPYGGIEDHEVRRRLDVLNQWGGNKIDLSTPHWADANIRADFASRIVL